MFSLVVRERLSVSHPRNFVVTWTPLLNNVVAWQRRRWPEGQSRPGGDVWDESCQLPQARRHQDYPVITGQEGKV
jgi:hypothetical protein